MDEYFPKDSYTAIDINNFEESVRIIDALIERNAYEEARDTLKECKELVLEDYNMFNYLAGILDRMDPTLPRRSITVKPAKSMHSLHNIYNYIIKRNIFKLKRSIAKMFRKDTLIK